MTASSATRRSLKWPGKKADHDCTRQATQPLTLSPPDSASALSGLLKSTAFFLAFSAVFHYNNLCAGVCCCNVMWKTCSPGNANETNNPDRRSRIILPDCTWLKGGELALLARSAGRRQQPRNLRARTMERYKKCPLEDVHTRQGAFVADCLG